MELTMTFIHFPFLYKESTLCIKIVIYFYIWSKLIFYWRDNESFKVIRCILLIQELNNLRSLDDGIGAE